MISSLLPNLTKTTTLSVTCNSSSNVIDTGLNVSVKNLKSGKIWTDYVPIRFYKGLVPITVATKSTENNSNAALNGFFIYPDGNSQFFQVEQGSYKTLYVPSFEDDYKLAFSGATIEGSLSNSTEMAYTVSIGSKEKKDVDISTEDLAMAAVQFGEANEANETEDTAYNVNNDFTAYIAVKDIDFYSFKSDSTKTVSPEEVNTETSYSDTISSSDSTAYYSFYAHAGTTYNLTKTDNSFIYLSAGSKIDAEDNLSSSTSTTRSFSASTSGTVYIKLSSYYYSYSHTLTVENSSYPVHLSRLYLSTESDSILYTNGYKIYSFSAETNKSYTINCPTGFSISAGSDNASPTSYFSSETTSQTIIPSTDETVYIKVQPNTSTGSFSLTVTGTATLSLSLYESQEGSSEDTCISLTPSTSTTWTTGTLTSSTQSLIYKFYASSGSTYTIYWADSYEGKGSNDTIDVKVSASTSSDFNTTLFNAVDSGYNSGKTISNTYGYVYIKVEPYSSGTTGSFRIRVSY